jgi:hypothetical protein
MANGNIVEQEQWMSDHTKTYPTRGDLTREQVRRRGAPYWNDVVETIRVRLAKLPPDARAAFAVACAERLLRAHEQLPEDEQREMTVAWRPLIDAMWTRLGLPSGVSAATDAMLSEIDTDDEDENDPPDEAHYATMYAARCVRAGDVANAVWAARRVVDAALAVARTELALDENTFAWDPAADPPMPAAQQAMHSHVQSTLARLLDDVERLERDGVSAPTLGALRS